MQFWCSLPGGGAGVIWFSLGSGLVQLCIWFSFGSALVQLVVVIGSLDRLLFSVDSALVQIGMA